MNCITYPLSHLLPQQRTYHLRANMIVKESQKSGLVLPPLLDTTIALRDQRMPVLGQHDAIVLLGPSKPLDATNSSH